MAMKRLSVSDAKNCLWEIAERLNTKYEISDTTRFKIYCVDRKWLPESACGTTQRVIAIDPVEFGYTPLKDGCRGRAGLQHLGELEPGRGVVLYRVDIPPG